MKVPTPPDPEVDPPASMPAFSPISRAPTRQRISDLVQTELFTAIRDLRLRPGAVVSETDLARRLGVSRTPVREAISRLVDHGLLTVVAQVGTRVSLIDIGEVEEAVFIRSALETAAFREACAQRAPDVTTMREILDRQEAALGACDASLFFESDEELHQELFRLGGYPRAWTVVRRSKTQLDRLRRLMLPEALETRDLIEEHIRIVKLLADRDVNAGIDLLNRHARRALRGLPRVRSLHPTYFTHGSTPPPRAAPRSRRQASGR